MRLVPNVKIKLIMNHGGSDNPGNLGAFFQTETDINAVNADEAELLGREFAILDAAAVQGMIDAQKVIHQTGDGD